MTKNKQLLIAIGLASILITGGLNIAPNAYSSSNHDDDHDDKETCECEKPSVFSVIYNGPGTEDGVEGTTDAPVTIEIYKKSKDIGNSEKKLASFPNIVDGNSVVLDSSMFGKKKINSNTIYQIIQEDVSIATISIHTSCSQSLFVGDMYTDGSVTLTVEFGQDDDGEQSIFLEDDPICTEIPMKIPAKITFFNSITTDNGVTAPDESEFGFSITGITDAMFATTYEIEPEVPITISLNVPTDFTRVLITGENCPQATEFDSALGTVTVTLQQEQNLVCTIYHDDNSSGISAGPGTIFRHNSMQVLMIDNQFGNSCDKIQTVEEKNVTPCIEIINRAQQRLLVVDSALVSDTTIVLFSMTEDGKIDGVPEDASENPDCVIEVIVRHNLPENFFLKDDDDTFPTNPSENLGFLLNCGDMDVNKVYNVNYAMIDPI